MVWKTYVYNMTPHSGNIAKWMGENEEEIMRDSRDHGKDGGMGAALAADRHS